MHKQLIYSGIVILAFVSIAIAAVAGSLDKRFDADGRLIAVNGNNGLGRDIALQPDGKIVIVGQGNAVFAVTRLNPDGSFDTTFDGDGRVLTDVAGGLSDAISVEILPDGKILVSGYAASPGPTGQDFALVRYNSNGSLDTTFDTDGKVTTDFGSATIEAAMNILIQEDGKYVLAGRTVAAGNDYAIARYNTDGSLDTTFDADGKVVISPTPGNDLMWSAAIQANGRILVAGSFAGATADFGVIRLTTSGALDPQWDGDGIVSTDIAGTTDQATGLAIQADGRIVAAGSASMTTTDFAIVRYNANGTLNAAGFGTGGKVTTDFNSSTDTANGIVIQPDGRIVAIGQSNQNGTTDVAIARFTSDGALDTSFDGDGRVVTDFSGSDSANEGVLTPDGKLLAIGYADSGGGAAVARYNLRTFSVNADFDGDDRTDISIFRPASGQWWLNRSTDGLVVHTFGNSADRISPADFTGDGKSDVAIFRPSSGEWFVLRSEDFSFYSFPFGANGDVPVPGDYDGDGKADAAVFRPSNSTWYIANSSGGTTITAFGAAADKPVPADYDGDGRTDLAIYRPSLGQWWLSRTSAGTIVATFGIATDKPVQGDYTGDGRADVAFFRPSSNEWFILRSENFSYYSSPFGAAGDLPAPGDYDGDGKFDVGVFRPSGTTWFLNRSTAGILIQTFGGGSDQIVPAAFLQ